MFINQGLKKKCVLLSIMMLAGLPEWQIQAAEPTFIRVNGTLECNRVINPPAIDGRLDDSCWKRADRVTSFSLYNGKGLSTQQTIAYVARDDNALYIAFRCYEEKMADILTECKDDDTPVWLDDSIEIFIDTNHDHLTYSHFMVNSLGVKSAARKIKDKWGDAVKDDDWKPQWQTAAQKSEKEWSVEVAIPFSELEVPAKDTIWGINLNRGRKPEPIETSCFCCTFGWFHTPTAFGHLTFQGRKVYLSDMKLKNTDKKATKTKIKIELITDSNQKIEQIVTYSLKPDEEKNIDLTEILNKLKQGENIINISLLDRNNKIIAQESFRMAKV